MKFLWEVRPPIKSETHDPPSQRASQPVSQPTPWRSTTVSQQCRPNTFRTHSQPLSKGPNHTGGRAKRARPPLLPEDSVDGGTTEPACGSAPSAAGAPRASSTRPGGLELAALTAGLDPMAFVMAVALGGSASFLTPYGYTTNLMVQNLGGYSRADYLRFVLATEITLSDVCISQRGDQFGRHSSCTK